MAFAVENYAAPGIPLDDPNFVKFLAVNWHAEDGEWTPKEIPIYQCTDADYEKFWPLVDSEKARLETLKENKGLYCVDWTDETINMYGTEASGNTGITQVAFFPCHVMDSL